MNDKVTNVLLVEDNRGDARLLQEALGDAYSAEFKLVWVERLEEALKAVAKEEWHVVLLDLSLPDGRGLETVTRMHGAAPGVPIVVLTGLDDEALAVKAVREGAQDYMIKGEVDGRVLRRAIRYAIERKRAAEALRESEGRYRLLAENVTDIIWTADLNLRFTYVSPSVTRLRGYTVEEVKGQRLDEALTPSSCESARRVFAEELARENGGENDRFKERTLELEHMCKDGSTVWTETRVVFLHDAEGRATGMLGVSRDITERKKAEEEKRRLQEQLAQAQKMKALGTLSGGIAHEFNNINAAIIGYIDLTLQMEELCDTARRNLKIVRASAVRGADLTKSLLAFSGKEVGEKKPVELRHVVDEVLRMTEKEFTSEGIEVTVGHSTRVPTVMGDGGLLTHAVMNLVINARHAMLKSPVKRLTIQTGVEKDRPFVRVTDTGCGIPQEHLPRIFEPFFTTKGSLASGGVYDGKVHGTGLGLSVCHSIVEGHGGEIRVSSQVGKGTTFTIYLPAGTRRKTTRRKVEEAVGKKVHRVMVVDDEEAITDLLVQILDREGYAADGFTDAREALNALWRKGYSLVFVDLQMPEMKGEDFMERINDLPAERRPVKVILTGRLNGPERDYSCLGVFATLLKPFSNRKVLEIVEEGLAVSSGSKTPELR